MTAVEDAAINLHDYMWENLGVTADWPLQMSGDDKAISEVIRLLNGLQAEIKRGGLARKEYCRKEL